MGFIPGQALLLCSSVLVVAVNVFELVLCLFHSFRVIVVVIFGTYTSALRSLLIGLLDYFDSNILFVV